MQILDPMDCCCVMDCLRILARSALVTSSYIESKYLKWRPNILYDIQISCITSKYFIWRPNILYDVQMSYMVSNNFLNKYRKRTAQFNFIRYLSKIYLTLDIKCTNINLAIYEFQVSYCYLSIY